ncbi:MAG: hypothetical protein JNJ50_03425 [Acidobacteria bacterium]|nr:hypothetical protein [Acidobacteriota bacterium]
MKFVSFFSAVASVSCATLFALAQTPGASVPQPASEKLPVVIVSHKIGTDYYPMLDRPGLTTPSMAAENADVPLTENERIARQQRPRSSKNATASVPAEGRRDMSRLRSYTRVINDAQEVQAVIRNTDTRPIKSVIWDFAFPRYENGQLLSRYEVVSKVELKPGGKKTLKYQLPPGAKRCEVVRVMGDDAQSEKANTFEAVCGQGFHDPSLLKQKQETISIKRIEYADGTIWQKQ